VLRQGLLLWLQMHSGHSLVLRMLLACPGIQGQTAQSLNKYQVFIPACHSPLQSLMLTPELHVHGQQLLILLMLLHCLLLQGSHLIHSKIKQSRTQ
jgi:hypothetical protein